MVLGFKKQFVDKILGGSKIHTIRRDQHNRWKTGNSIQFATGVRTKNYHCFKIGRCESYQIIQIVYPGFTKFPQVFIDGFLISDITFDQLIKNDGFDNAEDFYKWFDKSFEGIIIHWTKLRY